VAGFFVGYMAAPEVLARGGNDRFAQNCKTFYEHLRDKDLYITYTIVPPQIDRSKPAHQQTPPDLYAGVVKERDDGIIIRGAQMLGTGTVYSDYVQLSTIHPMRPGDENYAISVAIPCSAPGVRIYSRRSYAAGATSMFDYPLASRFDETDSLLVFDDVFVPWEHVFIYRNVELARAQWFETPAHVIGNNQAQIRFVTKLRFLMGLARGIVEMTGSIAVPQVQGMLGELAMYAASYEGLVDAQIEKAKPNANGVYVPDLQCLYAAMNLQSWIYPKMLDMIRELSGGGMIQLPSSVKDFLNPETSADISRYIQSPGSPAEQRVKFMKLCWDAIGSEFASRHDQYEKFYAGAPFLVRGHLFRNYNFKKSQELVNKALAGYDIDGRVKAAASQPANQP
jgi:4-hydroxyphenylacetate 3-monooxygenase